MKNAFALVLSMTLFALIACNETAPGTANQAITSGMEGQKMVQVIDFHTTHRCFTCNTIEQKTKDALNAHFAKELESGLLSFQVINIDEEENYALAEAFEAAGTALFVHIVSDAGSEKIDLTDFAFMNAGAEDQSFEEGLIAQVQAGLAKLN